ncbi:hypothetical protein [Nocardioides aquiterrae]|uniref:Uncharacterized protein n=1 Tax=Nocardioides aquiterrae TaxID=203799 RepID=A0ABN1UCQ2_9ACTN
MNRRVSVTIDADVSSFNRALLGASATARTFASDLESADGRMANLVQAGLALAPALVPLGALGVPALAGLANQLGATAAAAGVTVLAFQGVGDALKALNDYQIDPTDAHLKKLQETMDALGPAGQIFVRQLQELRPELQDFQDIAQQGLFPGLDKSIDELMTLAPEVEHIIGTISRELGRLAQDGAEHLNTDRWRDFISYLDHEAAPTLSAMGKTLGYVVEGLASLMMRMDPLADSFTQGMVGYAKAFRDWADGLDQSQGFQDFVDYIQQNGPEAMDTLAAIAGALIALVTAAAPVGSAVLPVIEALADGLAALADSPVGPILIGAAAAIGTLGRALAILNAVGLRSGDSVLGRVFQVEKLQTVPSAIRAVTVATNELRLAEEAQAAAAVRARDAQFAFIPTADKRAALAEYTAAQQRVTAASEKVAAAEKSRSAALRAGAAQAGKSAAAVGGLALAMSGYAEKSGLANAATFGMMGTIAGPYGAAIGTGIGLTMDLAAANNGLEKAIRGADAAMKSADLVTMADQVTKLKAALADNAAAKDFDWSLNPVKHVSEGWQYVFSQINDSSGEARAKLEELQSAQESLVLSVNALGQAFGAQGFKAGRYVDDLGKLAPVLERARPAMEELGISTKDLQAAVDNGSIGELVDQIVSYTHWMDTAAGRTQRIADSMATLDNRMVSTKMSAEGLKDALDDLLGPQLGLSEATDAWTTALRHLSDDLDKNNKTLKGNSDAAITNRAAIRQRVEAFQELLVAEANAGASSKQLSGDLKAQKKALIDAGEAAGISRGQMVAYLKELGLTPKLVKTLIVAQTDEAKAAIRAIKAQLDDIPRSISTTWYVNQVNAISKGGFEPNPDHRGADGLTVPKTGLPYADRHLILAADGEEVVSNRYGGADKNRAELKAASKGAKLAVVGYADGGTIGGQPGLGFSMVPGGSIVGPALAAGFALGNLARLTEKQLQVQQRLMEKEVERAQKAVDLAREHRNAVRDDIAAIKQSIADRLKSDIFAKPDWVTLQRPDNGGVFASAEQERAWALAEQQVNASLQQNPADILRADIREARQREELFRRLKRAGLHGDALLYAEQNADNGQLQALLDDQQLLQQYQQLYNRRDRIADRVGELAGMQRWGNELARFNQTLTESKAILHRQEMELRAIRRELARARKEAKKNSEDNADKVAAGVNGASAAGQRGRVAVW